MVMIPAETLEMQEAETRDRLAAKNVTIDRLVAENARLREALKLIADWPAFVVHGDWERMTKFAREQITG